MAPADATDTPTALRRAPDGLHLVATWSDGGETVLAAKTLRQACHCSQCTARQARGEPIAIATDVSITTLTLIGSYAVNIIFSDGHSRGIFPWTLLRTLAGASGGS
jgi:DUF971 family protein